jgi:hypothetical protein
MAARGNFTKEGLELLGLAGLSVDGILDTPEKARELREEVEREVEPELRKLARASAESQAKASRYPM